MTFGSSHFLCYLQVVVSHSLDVDAGSLVLLLFFLVSLQYFLLFRLVNPWFMFGQHFPFKIFETSLHFLILHFFALELPFQSLSFLSQKSIHLF